MIIDLFAGPGGWSEGLRLLDPNLHAQETGIEWDDAACATRSAAGHRTIRADIATYPLGQFQPGQVEGLIASPPCTDFSMAGGRKGLGGDSGHLVNEVMRWAVHLEPRWIACEQVPPVLPIWESYAAALRAHGYSTWTGVLNAADYGVPQTRKRAFLIASRDRVALPPEPTHAKNPAPSLFGGELAPWVTMAEALGWDAIVNTGRDWKPGGTRADAQTIDGADVPAPCLTRKSGEQWILTLGDRYQPNAAIRTVDEPAPTILASADNGNTQWRLERPWDDLFIRGPARDPDWPLTRPATTLAGDPRIPQPGHKHDDKSPNSPGRMEGAIKLTVAQALALQSFRPDYPVQGNKSKQFEQVGNAVAVLMAAHVLSAATGAPFHP